MVKTSGSRVVLPVALEPNTLEYHARTLRPARRGTPGTKTLGMKTNATRILDDLGVAYTLREYEVDPDDLTAQVGRSIVIALPSAIGGQGTSA